MQLRSAILPKARLVMEFTERGTQSASRLKLTDNSIETFYLDTSASFMPMKMSIVPIFKTMTQVNYGNNPHPKHQQAHTHHWIIICRENRNFSH